MAKKKMLEPNKIHILDFKVLRSQIESPFEFDLEKVINHSFQVGFDLSFNLDDLLVKTDFNFEIVTESESDQTEEAKGVFHFAFVFRVENLKDLIDIKKESRENIIDSGLANAVASITYSTSRGILMVRFQGTAFKNFILPVIDPNELLKMEKK